MNDINEKVTEAKDKDQKDKKVQVTVLYTSTAKDKKFNVALTAEFKSVIEEAYDNLKEKPREGDRFFCHEEPRHDLAGYIGSTLEEMYRKKVCVREGHGNKLEFDFDLDSEIGGAAR